MGGWGSVGVGFDITKNLSASLGEEMRYNFSIAQLYQSNSDVALSYKLNKHFKVAADYRFSIRPDKYVQRIGASVTYRKGFGDLDASIKTRMQYSFTPDLQEGTAWRNKLAFKYDVNKHLSPFLSGELFYSIANDIDQFDDYRLEAGCAYDLNKHNEFTLSWLYDHEFNVNNPGSMHVITFGYYYSF